MKVTYGRVALATVLAASLCSGASAQTFELDTDRPTIAGMLDHGAIEGQQKAAPAQGEAAVYIVQLTEPSMAAYDGGISGYAATSNRMTGDRHLNVNSQAGVAYASYLEGAQDRFVADCEAALGHSINVAYRYQHVFNGVAMTLTADEAKIVAAAAGVKSIERERMEVPMTDAGPAWIGAPNIWNPQHSGLPSSMGEGAVVAVLDTGINSDHPSFADIGGDGYDHTNPLGSGNYIPGSHCDANPDFCNDKLIGAWGLTVALGDPLSPEDTDGHGSHTASTAAGNVVLGASLGAPTTVLSRDISGVAPHANIIMYDVCVASCPGSALLAAVNQVVIDAAALPNGIQSLNFSISGGSNPYNDAIELGFLNATAAGIYVAASAGNAGPGASTVAHLGPWVSTTAAMTHDRFIENEVNNLTSDGDPLADITGLGLTAGYGPATIINSADLEGAFPGSTLCGLGSIGDFNPPWPPGTFNGEIVACTRGTFGRVEKGANALSAGAGGYILMDNGGGLVGDAHVLPGVHISQADGAVLAAWLAANPNPVGSITGFIVKNEDSAGDIMAGFSSRGPNTEFNVVKPDIGAPGASIFAAEANGQAAFAPEYQFLSGTSMASPHNAGAGALVSMVRPDWTPYEIKSALMMTAEDNTGLKEDGSTPTDPFDFGAGRVDLSRVQSAGVVLSETPGNFLASNPATGGDPSALNIASMQNGLCIESCEWTRTVTNTSDRRRNMKLSTTGPAGLGLSTDPNNKVKLRGGESGDITVVADTRLAAPGWNFATLEMEDSAYGPDLHMPIAVFAANTSNGDFLNKTVDAATAAEDEPLNYEISITNGPVTGQIDLTDQLPHGLDFVEGSETVTVNNGTTTVPFTHDNGLITWSGELDAGGLQMVNVGAQGFPSLAAIGVGPFGCPGNCDDGGFILNVPPFLYNGEVHSQVIWSVNGTLEAGTASGQTTSFFNRDMPDVSLPNNLLAPFWTDLNMGVDGDGAEWHVATFNGGLFTAYEWSNIPLFGDTSNRYSFAVWTQNDASGNIWFVYHALGSTAIFATVGVENSTGTNGFSYYFDGAGTPPAPGSDLAVFTQAGGSATFTYQVELEKCGRDGIVVNRVNLSGATEETAIAVTECVDDDGDSDSNSH